MPEASVNPDSLPGASPPRLQVLRVNGTTLHVEVRGSGPVILIIHGGGEDAEVWRPVAERLVDHTVVTYDRRGTLRSGRDDWPGTGSGQHADDAAALLRALRLDNATALGTSSAGIVALQLALRHPTLVRRALVHEPGLFRQPGGEAPSTAQVEQAVDRHLAARPGDWMGALAVFRHEVASVMGRGADQLTTPKPGKEWYAAREEVNAEAFFRDDLAVLTRERVDEMKLASSDVDIRFTFGTESMPVFRAIVTRLAAVRDAGPIAVEGVGHLIQYDPDLAAALLRAHAGAGHDRAGRLPR